MKKLLYFIICLSLCQNAYADFNNGDYFGKGLIVQASGVTVTGGGRTLNFLGGTTITTTGNKYNITPGGGSGGGGGSGSCVGGTFTNSSLSSGVLTATHNFSLTAPYAVNAAIYNNNNIQILPDNITGQANSILVALNSYGTISGTWGYSICAVSGSTPPPPSNNVTYLGVPVTYLGQTVTYLGQ